MDDITGKFLKGPPCFPLFVAEERGGGGGGGGRGISDGASQDGMASRVKAAAPPGPLGTLTQCNLASATQPHA